MRRHEPDVVGIIRRGRSWQRTAVSEDLFRRNGRVFSKYRCENLPQHLQRRRAKNEASYERSTTRDRRTR